MATARRPPTTAAALKAASARMLPHNVNRAMIAPTVERQIISVAPRTHHGESTATPIACRNLRIALSVPSRALTQPAFVEAAVVAVEIIFHVPTKLHPGLWPVIFSL